MNLFKINKPKNSPMAKNTILTVFLALFTLSSYAQDSETKSYTDQGKILINGSILAHYTTTNINDDESTAFTTNIMPKAGYFIKDNLVVGLELGISTSSSKIYDSFLGEDIKTTTSTISAGIFSRYYFANSFFVEGLAAIGTKKFPDISKTLGTEIPHSTSTVFGFRGGVGYVIELGSLVALEPTINYSWEKEMPKDAPSGYKNTLSSIFLGVGFTVFL